MVWINDQLGPGPERMRNEWFNGLQGRLESNRNVLRTFRSGVIRGCKPTFVHGKVIPDTTPVVNPKIEVAAGEVISDGLHFAIAAEEFELLAIDDGELYYWVFVDRFGKLNFKPAASPIPWPRLSGNDPAEEERDLAVLALGRLEKRTDDSEPYYVWKTDQDLRYMVREKPNGATLVVGDPNAGADFTTIQQALDFLAACDEAGNEVPRRIVVTTDQALSAPLKVGCHGVTIEGVRNEVGPPEDLENGDEPVEQRVVISWKHASNTNEPSEDAAIDAGGFDDLRLVNLHFIHTDTDAWCAIHDPGHRFTMEGCVLGEEPADSDSSDSRIAVAVSFAAKMTDGVRVEGNRAYRLGRGLFGFVEPTEAEEGFTTGCLRRSLVARNLVTTNGLVLPTAEDGNPTACWWLRIRPLPEAENWSWKDPKKYFYAIDMGVNPDSDDGCLYNIVEENVVDLCFNGIRVGKLSKVRSNVLRRCIHFGVMATATGEVTLPTAPGSEVLDAVTEDEVGGTEVSGNFIELDRFHGVPWWRAGIRLEMSTCHVTNNTVVVGKSKGCGIVHGPLDMSVQEDVKAHFAALRTGNHAVTGNSIVMNPILPGGTIAHRLAVTRGGIGVALLSTQNRVTDNGVYHARTGILVTAYNVVADNVISPAVVAIFAWAHNTVSGNAIGWFPHTAPGLPWELAVEGPTGALMLSTGNTCDGNTVVCGADNPDDPDAPAAIHVRDWPGMLFGDTWDDYFNKTAWRGLDAAENPMAARIQGCLVGGNTIFGHVIELSNPAGAAGDPSSFFNVDGIVLNGDGKGNTVSGTGIWRGYRGIVVSSGPAIISGCSAYLCRDLCLVIGEDPDGAPGSDVSGSVFYTTTGQPVRIHQNSSDTSLNDCMIAQMSRAGPNAAPEQRDPARDAEASPVTVVRLNFVGLRAVGIEQRADRVSINDCAVVNRGNAGIYWSGNFGVCGGCWFYTMDETSRRQNQGMVGDTRYPAIRFAHFASLQRIAEDPGAHYYPSASTQGNLVFGAHMLHSAILVNYKPSGQRFEFRSSPIEWSNEFFMYDCGEVVSLDPDGIQLIDEPFTKWNPHPPGYNQRLDRWTNRVCVESCYYWDFARYLSYLEQTAPDPDPIPEIT